MLIHLISENFLYPISKEPTNQISTIVIIYIPGTEPNRCIGMTDSIPNPE